jgi:predicted transglutaminase-like cysteine proteinase
LSAEVTVTAEEALTRARSVHRDLLRRFIWTADDVFHGVPEHWCGLNWREPGFLHGDCDDFALAAAEMLLTYGIPPDWVRLVYCLVEVQSGAGGHLVCTLALPRLGEFVLDNRQRAVWARAQVPYTWVSMRQLNWPMLEWRTCQI